MLTGISTLVDLEVPLPKLCAMVAAAGFDCISLCHNVEHSGYHSAAGRREIAALLDRHELQLNYIHPPIQAYYDLTSLDEQVRRLTLEMLKLSIFACAELGGRAVTVHACNERKLPEHELAERIEAGLRSLEVIVPFAQSQEVMFCLENLPCHYGAHAVTMGLLENCELPGLYVTLDPNHAWVRCEDPRALVRQLAPRARATNISDTFGQLDSHLLPGRGKVDLDFVARELAANGFSSARGDVVDLECSVQMQRKRIASGKLHEGDPGWRDPQAKPLPSAVATPRDYGLDPPSTVDYLMLAHAAAMRFGELVEAPAKAA